MKARFPAVVTCEHAVNSIPPGFRGGLSERDKKALATHKGYDLGALAIARSLAAVLKAPFIPGNITRLLVDLNRSESNRKGIFGSMGQKLGESKKEELLEKWHRPFRRRLEEAVELSLNNGGMALLLSVHSFTPVMNGLRRNADIGLLYDPSRERERALARILRAAIMNELPGIRIRMNYPYRGVSDGSATAMRKKRPGLIAIELEFNQRMMEKGADKECFTRIIAIMGGLLMKLRIGE